MQTTSVLFYCRQLSLVIVICRLCYLVLVSIAGGRKHVNHIDIFCGRSVIMLLSKIVVVVVNRRLNSECN